MLRTPFLPDWNSVRRKLQQQPWAAESLEAVRQDFCAWRPQLSIPEPHLQSEWTHHYFCDDDGTRLIFNPREPHRHLCAKCGRSYSGEPWDGAWRTMMHNAAGAQAERAALLCRLGSPAEAEEAKAFLVSTLSYYAENYLRYAVHGSHAGKGRITPQCLDEAIFLIGLFRAVRWSGIGDAEPLRTSLRSFAEEGIKLLQPQVTQIHNIHCWMLAAIAYAASLIGDEQTLLWCRDNPVGAQRQVLEGFSAEGLWYEVNPGYHYYTVAGLLVYLEAFGEGALSSEAQQRLALAVNNPPKLVYEGNLLPAYGDGWPVRTLAEYATLAEQATGLLGQGAVDVATYYGGDVPRAYRLCFEATPATENATLRSGRFSTAALVYGAESVPVGSATENCGSFLWPNSGLALLCNDRVRLGIRFGADAGWHDHRDKLCTDVSVRLSNGHHWHSLDMGTSGYGADFTKWMRCPVAHNLIVVNGEVQQPHTGQLLEYSAEHVSAESVWGGRHFVRTLRLAPSGWDEDYSVQVEGDSAVDILWAFHGDGVFHSVCGGDSPVSLEAGAATTAVPQPLLDNARWLRNFRAVAIQGGCLQGSWHQQKQGEALALTMPLPEGFRVYAAEADGDPLGGSLGLLFVCGHAPMATFSASFRAKQ